MKHIDVTPRDLAEAHRHLVEDFYRHFLAGDLAQAAQLCSDAVVLHVGGDHPLAGEYCGLEGVLDWVARSTDMLGGGSEHFEVLDVLGGGDHGAAFLRVTGERPGRVPLDNRTVHLHRIVEGRIAEVWFHNRDQSTVDAFWS